MPHECPLLADVQHAFRGMVRLKSSSQFSIPLLIRRRRDGSLRMRLSTLWPIPVCLHSTEINVPIVAYSYFWDFLYCNDLVSPKEVEDGYVCKHCLPEAQKLYPSREALWREHLFEDLLDWVNGKVASQMPSPFWRAGTDDLGFTFAGPGKTREQSEARARSPIKMQIEQR